MAKIVFTAGRVGAFICPSDKKQAFTWDVTAPGLGLWATPAGKPSYIFQSRHAEQTIRMTIGSPESWSIPQAQEKARELQRLIDEGHDPRDLKRDRIAAAIEKKAAAAAKVEADKMQAVTVGEVWAVYIEERKPHWGDLHYRDHIRKAAAGGEPFKRGTGITKPGPLFPLMALPLRDLTALVVEAWAALEAQTRPTSARLAWRCLKVFLGWCEEQPVYAPLMPAKNPAKTKKSREHLGRVNKKKDSLQREQLPAWFDSVQKIGNPCISAYLQVMLLTGARPGEIITMQWEHVNTQWKGITIRDKVDKVTRERTIPLTPYVAHLLSTLPRRNGWVFSSATSETGHLTEPNHPHTSACTVAGIAGLTLHGLRRSFKSASEWLDIPNGVRQNIMGHVAKSTDEDYTIRPLDLLRVHHEKIEAWILEQAGVTFEAKAAPGALRVVNS
jgi:integrase